MESFLTILPGLQSCIETYCRYGSSILVHRTQITTSNSSQVYGSARKSYIQKLDTVHHQGLRLAMGAFRTSPIQSLYVLSQEPSLEKRRLKLALQFALKLKTNPSNPAHEYAFNCVNEELYDARPKSIRPFGLKG